MVTVRVHTKGNVNEFKVQPGKNMLEFLWENSLEISTPCGGKGRCGKCRVIVKGTWDDPSPKERALLGDKALSMGYRLACYNRIESDIEIYMDDLTQDANILVAGIESHIEVKPVIKKEYVEMAKASIHDQRPDASRIADALGSNVVLNSVWLMRQLPEAIRKDDYKATIITKYGGEINEIIGVEPGDSRSRFYGMAFDIGTTTIAAYLYDLNSGKRLEAYSALNPQRKFGADVLSRIDYASSSKECQDEMHMEITRCINDIIKIMGAHSNIKNEDVYITVFVGNTTMMHFLLNLPARNIAVSPFIPVNTGILAINATELGININEGGLAVILPSVSAYIGADTIAAVLAAGIHKNGEISLLVDIGTNGEIVLGNKEVMYSCSTAAGPAFEGANIRNGIGGIKGAIDKVYFGDKLGYTTIGNEKPIGICGSGIVDIVAGMLDTGIIDETGRIVDVDEATGLGEDYKSRLAEIDGLASFVIEKNVAGHSFNEIAITQKDVRELQNAKAAIAAGIKVLLKEAGIGIGDISKVYLAGGFGNYINIRSALKIGLLPAGLQEEKIISAGNAAGSGAGISLLSAGQLEEAIKIKNMIKYVELSSSREFVDEYVNSMFF
ncbi:MAG: DUF4445 domain-containing protein [Clostridiaceae bacterium]|nr:DUF4445 domain-containing protein [Clostridiaceae bacterium]